MLSFVGRSIPPALAGIAALALSFEASRAFAAPGDLDTNLGGFGAGGKIQNTGFSVEALAIDAQGRLLLAGSRTANSTYNDVAETGS